MIEMLIIVFILGSCVVARSDQDNTTVTIPPGYALQDYLCNGTLQSNITVLLDGDGEHLISSERSCNISNEGGSITITGSSTQRITIRCKGEGAIFAYLSVQIIKLEGITFIKCAIDLVSIENTFILNCTFQSCSNGAISSKSSTNTYIAGCAFSDTDHGVVTLVASTGNVCITNCTFHNSYNSGMDVGGAVSLSESTGNVHITDCTFHNNRVDSDGSDGGDGPSYRGNGGAVSLSGSTVNAHITDCTFHNNSAGGSGGAVSLSGSTGNVHITDCTFHNNRVDSHDSGDGLSYHGNGGAVSLSGSTGNVHITDCTFHNNRVDSHDSGDGLSYHGNGGAVSLSGSTVNAHITDCTFHNNSAAGGGGGGLGLQGLGGAVYLDAKVNAHITGCTFQNNRASNNGGANVHGAGGAVYLFQFIQDDDRFMYYYAHITHCTFQNNNADSDGGAVYMSTFGFPNISDCTFQNNSAGGNGGGVLLSGIIAYDPHITNCTFQNNRAAVMGGAVVLDSVNAYITDCTFQNNSAHGHGGAVSLSVSLFNVVYITDCTFENNRATGAGNGGAVYQYELSGNAHITDCTFHNNSAAGSGGAVCLNAKVNAHITGCTFQNNRASGVGGGGGAVSRCGSTGDTHITGCTFQNNRADGHGGGGGAVSMPGSTGHAYITGCTFQNNSASYAGGAVELYRHSGNVNITNSTFHINNAKIGGAIHIKEMSSYLFISMSSFTNNTSQAGAAMYAIHNDIDSYNSLPTGPIILQDVIVKDNHCSSDQCAGTIHFKGVILEIIGSYITGSHFVSNSPHGAIEGENGILQLQGYITFENNTGVNGGAISLSNNVPVYFYDNCKVAFLQNVATEYGGAIYNNGEFFAPNQEPTIGEIIDCILRFHVVIEEHSCNGSFSITFIGNHAPHGGHAVYATPIYHCNHHFNSIEKSGYCDKDMVEYFNIIPLPDDTTDVQVLSFPDHVNYCGCSDPFLCNGTSPQFTTHPGRTVRIMVTPIGNGEQLSPSAVYTQVDRIILLGPRQKAQWVGTVCGTMEYNIFGPEMASLQLLLYNDPSGSKKTVIDVKLLPCGPWFTLAPDMRCNCSQLFATLGVACDASEYTVTRNKTNWIGVYNNTLPAVAQTCPLDYCNSNITKMSPETLMDLCNGGRAGIICGHCPGNLSVVFGSSKCQVCSDMWLTTLVMFAVLGVFLVAALFFLNLTITQGTLYGLIFYANIIQVNASIFFNQSILNPLQVIVSFVNLDLGLPMCFYNNMDDADKAGLQFAFPAYLLILTMTTILVCHYCLQRSPTTSNGLSLYMVSNIIGERAVGVLSTLIYLSYSKMLRNVIDILTYSTVHLPSGVMKVWFYDGNVEYLHGKHTVLFVVAMVTCTLFLLPYTIALTFIPIIEQHSEHNRLFNYLHTKANQIKPMNDAHYAPYKGEWRWWLGARLWLLVVMYSLNPVYSSDRPSLLLTIQGTMMILFTVAQARIMPFGQSHQKTHQSNSRTNFYNRLYNSLDMFYLLNYTALAVSMLYIIDQSLDQQQIAAVAVGVLVGLYVVMLMVTVMYHLIVAILKACLMYDITREKFNALFEKKQYQPNVPINMEQDDPTRSTTVSATTVTVHYGLREPLSEDPVNETSQ